jgi:tight adherence protein C
MAISVAALDHAVREWNIQRRARVEIRQQLPPAIDLLALIVQAGLDFQVALAYYVEHAPKGALQQELTRVQQEIRVGIPRVEALKRLGTRVGESSVREFVQTVVQGIELGASLGPLLRTQAQALRRAQAAHAEKQAAKAPLKLLAPLLLFIFPTIFIVLFGPLALTVLRGGL